MSILDKLLGRPCPALAAIQTRRQQAAEERRDAVADLIEAIGQRKNGTDDEENVPRVNGHNGHGHD